MIGRQNRNQRQLFIAGDIDQFIPEDHVLKRVDRILDLRWLREEVRESYCEDQGRPGIDPEAAVRLMLAGFFHGIVHDRKLLRARRRRNRGWDTDTQRVYNRHRVYVEGVHGEGKTQHGLRRAIRRGLANVAIQVYLIAAVINLKRLAKALSPRPYDGVWYLIVRNRLEAIIKQFFGDWEEKLYSALICSAQHYL